MTNKKPNRLKVYWRSAMEEYSKITWPTKEQAALLTGITIVVSGIVTIFIAGVDLGFSELYQFILDIT
jgi:preprotein translocase SecE subunit